MEFVRSNPRWVVPSLILIPLLALCIFARSELQEFLIAYQKVILFDTKRILAAVLHLLLFPWHWIFFDVAPCACCVTATAC